MVTATNFPQQVMQIVTVVLGMNSLTLEDESTVKNPVNINENLQHCSDLKHLLWPWRLQTLLLRRLMFNLQVVEVER